MVVHPRFCAFVCFLKTLVFNMIFNERVENYIESLHIAKNRLAIKLYAGFR